MKTKTPFVILSAERFDLSEDENAMRTGQLRDFLQAKHIDALAVFGVYKGTRERSFLVLLPDGDSGDDYAELAAIAALLDQESILYVDASRYAFLDYLKPVRTVELGRWREVFDTADLDSYTIGPDGRTFAAGG